MEGTGGNNSRKVGYHAVLQSRMLKDGKLNCYWVTTNNNMQAGPNINDEMYPGWRNPANFVVVSEAYPTVSAMAADLILPVAMWTERKAGSVTPNAVPNCGGSRSRRPAKHAPTFGSLWSFPSDSKLKKSGRRN